MKSQTDRLIQELVLRPITFLDALKLVGTTSLHRRLTDARLKGWVISDRWIKANEKHVKIYRIMEAHQSEAKKKEMDIIRRNHAGL